MLLALAACADDDPVVDVDDGDVAEEEPAAEDDAVDDEPASEDDAADDGSNEQTASPDPALVEAPCEPHQGREDEAFLAVAAPVDGQDLGDGTDVELVGCSNVFEANVVWELIDPADDTVLAESFTTAECGNGCVGAFEDTIDLSAGADQDGLELHVLSPDVSDGEGQELREVVAVSFD